MEEVSEARGLVGVNGLLPGEDLVEYYGHCVREACECQNLEGGGALHVFRAQDVEDRLGEERRSDGHGDAEEEREVEGRGRESSEPAPPLRRSG